MKKPQGHHDEPVYWRISTAAFKRIVHAILLGKVVSSIESELSTRTFSR